MGRGEGNGAMALLTSDLPPPLDAGIPHLTLDFRRKKCPRLDTVNTDVGVSPHLTSDLAPPLDVGVPASPYMPCITLILLLKLLTLDLHPLDVGFATPT